jgi:hypothetical protein
MNGNPADLQAAPDGIDALTAEQTETVKRLNALTSLDWTVDAGAIPTYSQQVCLYGLDGSHGRGTVFFPDFDGGCPNCATDHLSRFLTAGDYVSVDVTR